MKVCKKCKKQVANRSKVCRYCGADVTKCKILKQEDNYTKTQTKKKGIKAPVVELKQEEKVIETISTKEKKKLKIPSIKEIKEKRLKEKKAFDKKVKTVKEIREHKIKEFIKLFLILIIILTVVFLIVKGTQKLFNLSGVIEVKENSATNIFDMHQKIKYKDVIYNVSDVYTSQGTEYKKPKEGNEFVIVTIELENKSDNKVRYSYKDWKMSDSEGNFKSRIFAPINVNTALYSGNLVVGAKKTGSMVFEEPIGDENLLLNYYEYQEESQESPIEKDSSEVVEEPKPIFSVRIKIEKEEQKETAN